MINTSLFLRYLEITLNKTKSLGGDTPFRFVMVKHPRSTKKMKFFLCRHVFYNQGAMLVLEILPGRGIGLGDMRVGKLPDRKKFCLRLRFNGFIRQSFKSHFKCDPDSLSNIILSRSWSVSSSSIQFWKIKYGYRLSYNQH